MSASTAQKLAVQRLLDMDVQEVSLVDSAANQRQFLIVKRKDMKKGNESNVIDTVSSQASLTESSASEASAENSSKTAESGLEFPSGEALSEGVQGKLDFSEVSDNEEDSQETAVSSQTSLVWATEALEALGQAIEKLDSEAQEGETQKPVLELARGLQGLAARVEGMGQAGLAVEPKVSPVSIILNSVRETLQRIEQGLQSMADPKVSPSKEVSEVTQLKTRASRQLETSLETILRQLGGIREILKDQQRRLTRVEKRFGLPNSSPVGEVPRTQPPEEMGWPLDLNRPQDRDHVEKIISFHDI